MASDRDELIVQLTEFVQERLLAEPDSQGIAPDTPLLEWGILTSINTAQLLTYIRDELGTNIPPTELTGTNFQNLDSITDLLLSLRTPVH
ncbi:acyl carrier protein [Streptomyces sp. AC512_CC834]|uniref:acyl carrier protein n=1 Tax=Streptomyces sp. AC512_CC834 TaxID=2823691 RepID=UPI001C260127|nr:acyl carrier protein [Streptomyces sp. AC512_CC834]